MLPGRGIVWVFFCLINPPWFGSAIDLVANELPIVLDGPYAAAVVSPRNEKYHSDLERNLRPRLSSKASIVHFSSAAPRWSDYHAPEPGTVVNVFEENDVLETVKFCIKNNLDFLAQNGAHGWTTTFKIGKEDVLINLRGLNKVFFSNGKDEVTFGGGAIVSEVVEASYQNGRQVATGNCNCIGTIGAILGGGLGRLMGRYGLGVDNLLSVNLVTAAGKLITVNPKTPSSDLWWALRGAGANFGIVTSITMKSYPTVNSGTAWIGNLIFTPDQVEAVTQTISDLDLKKEMSVHYYFAAAPPNYDPTVIVNPWYSGSAAEGKAAFKALYDLGPVADTTEELPYNQVNSGGDSFCAKGGRKPAYGAGLRKLDPATFRKIWNEYVSFLSDNPGVGQSSILVECYSHKTARALPNNSAAYPHRAVNFHALVIPWYANVTQDRAAEQFGEKVRKLWQDNSGFDEKRTYINFGHGDEGLQEIYGNHLGRLKAIKRQWDPQERFNQFFPIV